jgi:hypothetical protein
MNQTRENTGFGLRVLLRVLSSEPVRRVDLTCRISSFLFLSSLTSSGKGDQFSEAKQRLTGRKASKDERCKPYSLTEENAPSPLGWFE